MQPTQATSIHERRPARRLLLAVTAATLAAVTSAGAVLAASPGPAAANTDTRHRFCAEEWRAALGGPTVETLRAVGNCEIDRRMVTLDTLDKRVAASSIFTDLHKDQLRMVNDVNPASYEAERQGLRALRAKINDETDLKKLRELIADIAEEFRVYLLVVPKTFLVGGADATDKTVDRFGALASKLEALIDRADKAGKDVAEARRLLEDLRAKTRQAGALVDPVAGRLMPLSPSDWNEGKAGPAFGAARATLHDARELLRAARADARQIIELLGA
jgi:hypothetical protein